MSSLRRADRRDYVKKDPNRAVLAPLIYVLFLVVKVKDVAAAAQPPLACSKVELLC
ncbi:hypothetical protein TUN199_11868 [Pyrenophora tritici-repentis]|nr:hypothetical protein TUN205_11834 [Pyrenophora tritici-repentis]KAI0616144.1 hypothetical protein TUN199_11868 [Pyrenophora tritici-repentis]